MYLYHQCKYISLTNLRNLLNSGWNSFYINPRKQIIQSFKNSKSHDETEYPCCRCDVTTAPREWGTRIVLEKLLHMVDYQGRAWIWQTLLLLHLHLGKNEKLAVELQTKPGESCRFALLLNYRIAQAFVLCVLIFYFRCYFFCNFNV